MKNRFGKITSTITAVLYAASCLFSFTAYAEQETFHAEESVICCEAENLPADSELLLGYFESKIHENNLFHVNDAVSYSALGPLRLKGGDLTIYNAVREGIADIAAGKEASTAIAIPAVEYTYEQMGLTEDAENTDIQTAVKNSYSKIYSYILYDSPYELYWHNKSAGAGMSYSYTRDSEKITLTNFTIKFSAGIDYAGSGEFSVDTSKTSAATKAAENAAAIVAENAGKSDIEKLKAYKEKICELVTYDDNAADSTPASVGVDPWQIIHVFDNDNDTNVVCEGYSKAFYYLCLLSEFSGYIDCWTVSGYMNGGAHMWNVVAIGSRNYLVDVTNCDTGSIGNPDNLFLKGVSGSVAGGYSITINSTVISYTYKSDIISNLGKRILTLSDLDYSSELDDSSTYTGPDVEDDDIGISEEVVIWANGAKNFKTAEITPVITATNWFNNKGKTQKGKLIWTVMLNGTPAFDTATHKVTTKSDKTVLSASNKGKITAKAGGTAIVYVTDTGTLESEAFRVIVKNAPSSVFLFDSPEKTAENKKEKLKSVNVIAGGEAERVYIYPYAKQGEISEDCTYKITAKKNEEGIISFTDVKKDNSGNMYFDVSGNKILQEGKISKISLTVTCEQSNKKTSVNIIVSAPVSDITASVDKNASLTEDNNVSVLSLTKTISGTSTFSTDKLQAVVCTSEPVIDATGKKITFTKSKQLTAKLEKSGDTVTLKASKPVTEAASVYIITTDNATKMKSYYKIADIAADGTIRTE